MLRQVQATPTIQAIATGYQIDCNNSRNTLALVSMSYRLADKKNTQAEALSLVLILEGRPTNRVFSVYRFGLSDRKRDDDEGKASRPLPFDPAKTAGNLDTFFETVGCSGDQRLTSALADVLNRGSLNWTAAALAEAMAAKSFDVFKSTRALVGTTATPQLPATTPDAFASLVRNYATSVVIPGESEDVGKLKGQIVELQKQLGEKEQQLSALRGGQPAANTWISVFNLMFSLLVILGVSFLIWKGHIRGKAGETPKRNGEVSPAKVISLPEVASELDSILKTHHDRFKKVKTNPQEVRKVFDDLNRSVTSFQKKYPCGDPDDLNRILTESKVEFDTYANVRPEKYKHVFFDLLKSIEAYRQRHFLAPPQQNENEGAEQSKANGPAALSNGSAQIAPDASSAADAVFWQEFDKQFAERFDKLQISTVKEPGDVNERMKKELWPLCSPRHPLFTKETIDAIIESSREALTLIQKLRESFKITADEDVKYIKGKTENFFNELSSIRNDFLNGRELTTPGDILNTLRNKLDSDKEQLRLFHKQIQEVEDLSRTVGTFRRADETALATSERIVEEHRKLSNMLKDYREPEGLTGNVRMLLLKYESSTKMIIAVKDVLNAELAGESLPTSTAPEEMARRVVVELRSEREKAAQARQFEAERDEFRAKWSEALPQVEYSRILATEVSSYLNFNSAKLADERQPVVTLLQRLKEETPSYRRLRLGLAAARLNLDEALKDRSRSDVIKAMRLDDFSEKLGSLLTEIEDFRGDEVWRKGISSGLSDSWLHGLFRANLLLQTYFPSDDRFCLLRDAVEQACLSLSLTMREFDVEVLPVELFTLPGDMETEKNVSPDLREIAEVKRKIESIHGERRAGGFVVDVLAFSLKVGSERKTPACVVIMNPSDWPSS